MTLSIESALFVILNHAHHEQTLGDSGKERSRSTAAGTTAVTPASLRDGRTHLIHPVKPR